MQLLGAAAGSQGRSHDRGKGRNGRWEPRPLPRDQGDEEGMLLELMTVMVMVTVTTATHYGEPTHIRHFAEEPHNSPVRKTLLSPF